MSASMLPRGIISVVQTPFGADGAVDFASLRRLVEDAIGAGVAGFLVPVVASEVALLSTDERRRIVEQVVATTADRVPIIVGASSDEPRQSIEQAELAAEVEAAAYLVAVPAGLYDHPETIVPFFEASLKSEPA